MNYLAKNRPLGLISDIDRVFNQLTTGFSVQNYRGFAVDIAENDDAYQIEAELPGFEAADVDLRVEKNLLHIEGKVSESSQEESGDESRWHVRERRLNGFQRTFVLPDDVNKDAVEANMKNGILLVTLKKNPEAKVLTVKVHDS